MPTLIAAGDKADRIVSWGAVVTSPDGYIWNEIREPFTIRGKVCGVAYGNDRFVVVGDGGLASNSVDGITWVTDHIWYGEFQPLSLYYATNYAGNDGMFMTVGQNKFLEAEGPYRLYDEAAAIFKNTSGQDWGWELAYIDPGTNSRFYGVRRLVTNTIDVWAALGSSNSKPLGAWSLDNGLTWNAITFPTNLGIKQAYDVAITVSNNVLKYWITVNGMILNTTDLVNSVWDASRSFVPSYASADFIRIASNPNGHVVAVCSGGIAYTTDQVTWEFVEHPGYRFKSVIWFNDHWIVGAESNLTQYTHWISEDTINWTPENCGVQIYDFAII